MAHDCLDDAKPAVARREIATDGQWVWPRDLAYYVETYGVALPDDFIQNMRQRRWQPPTLSSEELAVVKRQHLGQRG
jgi:hypothetical protein